jgi:hypothetical protein
MTARRTMIWFGVVLAISALTLWSARKRKGGLLPSAPQGYSSPNPDESTGTEGSDREVTIPAPAVEPMPRPVSAGQTSAAPVGSKSQRMRDGLANLNDADVVLYGRVIDQFGAPVVGAIVSGAIGVNNGTRVGTDRISTTTDSNGSFTISGYKGKDMGVNVSKPKYVLATSNPYFVYSHLWPEAQRHVPDPKTPVILKMWKLQGAEPLAAIKQRYSLSSTGNPLRFDLLAGKAVAGGGDIEIMVGRPPGIVSQQHPQCWSIQVSAVDGGISETSVKEASVTFCAPDAGYQSTVSLTNTDGTDALDEMLFVKSRGGMVYSKVFLVFGINRTPDGSMDITFNGFANTNGSRNWEATAPQAR